ncbi:MAG: hypothetical protein NT062_34535, partial [Proteobacteria bacterium]|nr:hypothetical protein [Pseudomonadota bacterium]
ATDDDLAGHAYAISQDVSKDQKNLTGSGTFHSVETRQAAAKGSPKLLHITDGNLDAASSSVACQYEGAQWECNVKVDYKANEHWEPNGPAPNAVAAGTFATFGIGGIHGNETWSTATHDAHDHFTFASDHVIAHGRDTNHQKVQVAIEPLDPVKTYEVVFVTDKAYDQWLPEGPPIAPSTHQPDTVTVHVELRDPRTHRPIAKSFRTHYVLDGSHLDGECMNWPAHTTTSPDKPDLYFDPVKNTGDRVSSDQKSLELPDGHGGGAVTVSARDWGGWASLVAHVVVSDGVAVDAVVSGGKADGTASLALPKDDDGNHIADAWEAQATGGKRADADDEKVPGGWAAPGDGYTLFEEYRGFVDADPSGTVVPAKGPKKRHVRFDPKQRDAFIGLAVSDGVAPLALAAVTAWARMTNVSVHYIADSNLLVATPGDYPGGSFPRRADAWGDGHDDLFGKPQMALWVQSTQNLGTSPAHTDPIRDTQDMPDEHGTEAQSGVFGSFGDVHGVTLDLASAKDTVSGLTCFVDPTCPIPDNMRPQWTTWQTALVKAIGNAEQNKRALYGKGNHAELERRFTRFTLIHELGHAAGLYHHGALTDPDNEAHGDATCPMRYWHMGDNYLPVADFVGGKWDLTTAPDKTPWKWCAENTPQLRLADHKHF